MGVLFQRRFSFVAAGVVLNQRAFRKNLFYSLVSEPAARKPTLTNRRISNARPQIQVFSAGSPPEGGKLTI